MSEFPYLRYEDLPPEAVTVAKSYVRGILYNAPDIAGAKSELLTAQNIVKAVLQSVGWEPQP